MAALRDRSLFSIQIALPLPSVGWARDGPHAQPVVGGVAAGIAGDNYMVARFERVLLNSLTAQLAGGAPLGGPRDRLSLFSGGFHQNDRVWITEQKLDHPAFNRHRLERVGRGEGVVRPGVTTTEEGRADHQSPRRELSPSRHYTIISDLSRQMSYSRRCAHPGKNDLGDDGLNLE